MRSYEGENTKITGNQADKKYDAEIMAEFLNTFSYDYDYYRERANALENSYVRYHDNDTFVGEMADSSKRFIYEGQGNKLHNKNLELKRDFLNMSVCVENKFKEEVDPSPKARISIKVLTQIKKDYIVFYNVVDTKGNEIESRAKSLVNKYGKWGIHTVPNYRVATAACDKFCGQGHFLDNSMKKLEDFDQDACAFIDCTNLQGSVSSLQESIYNTSGALDSITIFDPFITRVSTGLSAVGLASTLQRRWFGFLEPANKETAYKETEIKEFLDKCGIKVNKLETNDGYFIIDKSIAEIFEEAGVDSHIIDVTSYDDWYITGLVKKNGSITYSIIKVREPMDEQEAKALAVPFNSMEITDMEQIIEATITKEEVDKDAVKDFNESIDKLSHAGDHWMEHNNDLLRYFKKSESEGSYLIANFAIDKVAHNEVFENGGTYELPFKYESFDDMGGRETLDHLSDVGIYDKKKNTITIKDPDNLTSEERVALLLISTGDRDVYAYAAENQFHAKAYDDLLYAPFKGSAIKSDAGVGESNGYSYEKTFKLPEGKLYKEQYKYHKEG